MTEPTYTISLVREDWEKVIQALRDTAWSYTQDSHRAIEKGAQEYGELLWEESAVLNAISDQIEYGIPE